MNRIPTGSCQQVACLITAILAASCGEEAPKAPASEDPIEAVPFEYTTVLGQASLARLSDVSADGSVLTFDGTTQELDGIEPDRVLVGGVTPRTPLGFVRRVEAVQRDGDRVIVLTSPTSIIYAFRKLKVHVQRDLDPATVQGALSASLVEEGQASVVGAVTASKDFEYGLDWPAFDGDGKMETTEDRVLVQGKLTATIGVTFDIDFDWGNVEGKLQKLLSLDILDVLSDIGFTCTMTTHFDAGASLHVEGVASKTYEKEIPLAPPLYLGAIVVPPSCSHLDSRRSPASGAVPRVWSRWTSSSPGGSMWA